MRSLGALQRLCTSLGPAPSQTFAASLAGTGCCRLRALATATVLAEQSKPEPLPDALDQEFDRGDDEAMARVRESEYEAQQLALREAGLKVPVDLECEFDRDDPDNVDTQALYADPVLEPLLEVYLDTEMDRDDPLLADKSALWEPPPLPPEVDLDTELDRDDPLLADKSQLWDIPEPPSPADINSNMDLAEEEAAVERAASAAILQETAASSGNSPVGAPPATAPFGQEMRPGMHRAA